MLQWGVPVVGDSRKLHSSCHAPSAIYLRSCLVWWKGLRHCNLLPLLCIILAKAAVKSICQIVFPGKSCPWHYSLGWIVQVFLTNSFGSWIVHAFSSGWFVWRLFDGSGWRLFSKDSTLRANCSIPFQSSSNLIASFLGSLVLFWESKRLLHFLAEGLVTHFIAVYLSLKL